MIIIYAKIVNNRIIYAPKNLNFGGNAYSNPPEEVLLSAGYKKLIETEMPTDAPEGKHYEYGVPEETDTEIIRTWVLVDDPEEPEPELSAEEALDIIMGVAE